MVLEQSWKCYSNLPCKVFHRLLQNKESVESTHCKSIVVSRSCKPYSTNLFSLMKLENFSMLPVIHLLDFLFLRGKWIILKSLPMHIMLLCPKGIPKMNLWITPHFNCTRLEFYLWVFKFWKFLKLLIEANVMFFSFFRHDQSNGVRNFDEGQIGSMFIIIITTTSTTFIIIRCHHHFLNKSLLICATPLLIGLLFIYWCYP